MKFHFSPPGHNGTGFTVEAADFRTSPNAPTLLYDKQRRLIGKIATNTTFIIEYDDEQEHVPPQEPQVVQSVPMPTWPMPSVPVGDATSDPWGLSGAEEENKALADLEQTQEFEVPAEVQEPVHAVVMQRERISHRRTVTVPVPIGAAAGWARNFTDGPPVQYRIPFPTADGSVRIGEVKLPVMQKQ